MAVSVVLRFIAVRRRKISQHQGLDAPFVCDRARCRNSGADACHLMARVLLICPQPNKLESRPAFVMTLSRLIIAHRGHKVAAPEQTIAAFAAAIELGAAMIEADLRFTRDGVP